ncbi:hypothetical protein AsAng_0017250 [Aureispira anguillae]|uniref:Uncharacterized protein n=1 Tax=Aureispira anguillae TaxID=2864201 RepID=A0A915YDC8_9BACT|nr:hypothetical protein AsAng_0017250 [Aureispira anguillae]
MLPNFSTFLLRLKKQTFYLAFVFLAASHLNSYY